MKQIRTLGVGLGLAGLIMTGCVSSSATGNGTTGPQPGEVAARNVGLPTAFPPMKAFGGTHILPTIKSNSLIGGDFLELSFQLESGRVLPVLSRFEGPISLRVTGRAPSVMQSDLDRLLARLRDEAGISIHQVPANQAASITIEVIPKKELQRLVPHAACFVAPNVSSWREYKSVRGSAQTDWALLRRRTEMAVFLPGTVSPQEMRDCLHEEVAQALGPVNDLYRLDDSVFNDDNFHTVLTGFDMLILRAFYAPELSSGMSRAEVAARLPEVLARLNPAGGYHAPRVTVPSPREWKSAIETALSGAHPLPRRRAAALLAVDIARDRHWNDTRMAFSLFAMGRLTMKQDSDRAFAAYREAEAIYRARSGTALQAAHMGVQLAAYALSAGRAEASIDIVNSHLPSVTRAENAALLSTLMMIKAEALELAGRNTEAQLVRLDSLGWARYGFGSNAQVKARLVEIAAISPG